MPSFFVIMPSLLGLNGTLVQLMLLLLPEREPIDIALDIIEHGSQNDLELFFEVAWSIWWNRNQALFDDSGASPTQVWEMANRSLSEFKAACSLLVFTPSPAPSTWHAPPVGFFKVNVDGAAFDDGRPSCIGVVICDS